MRNMQGFNLWPCMFCFTYSALHGASCWPGTITSALEILICHNSPVRKATFFAVFLEETEAERDLVTCLKSHAAG